MTVPDAEVLQDMNLDEDDTTLQTGLREAVAIATEARDHGRKRKMSPITQPSSQNTKENEDNKNVVNFVADQDEAMVRSALDRRRSKRKVLGPQLQELPNGEPFAGYEEYPRKIAVTPNVGLLSLCASSLRFTRALDARCLDQALFASADHLAYLTQF
jgi:hypothetical protein